MKPSASFPVLDNLPDSVLSLAVHALMQLNRGCYYTQMRGIGAPDAAEVLAAFFPLEIRYHFDGKRYWIRLYRKKTEGEQ